MRVGVVFDVEMTESSVAGWVIMVEGDRAETSGLGVAIEKSRVLGKGLVNTKVVLSDGSVKE
jgi:hypothetical protein